MAFVVKQIERLQEELINAESLSSTLTKKEAELHELRIANDQLKEKLEASMAKIQQELEDTLRKTVERDEQINKLKADLNTSAHHQATLKKDHESKMAEQTLRIAKQESEIGKLRAELKATNATNQDQASKLKSFERMIVEKDQLIGSQKVDIENIKAALNASNQQHEETLSQYEQKIQEKEDSIVLKQQQMDNERIENNRLNAESELEQYFFNINQSRHLFCLFLSFSHSNNNYSFCLINICKFKKRRWCA